MPAFSSLAPVAVTPFATLTVAGVAPLYGRGRSPIASLTAAELAAVRIASLHVTAEWVNVPASIMTAFVAAGVNNTVSGPALTILLPPGLPPATWRAANATTRTGTAEGSLTTTDASAALADAITILRATAVSTPGWAIDAIRSTGTGSLTNTTILVSATVVGVGTAATGPVVVLRTAVCVRLATARHALETANATAVAALRTAVAAAGAGVTVTVALRRATDTNYAASLQLLPSASALPAGASSAAVAAAPATVEWSVTAATVATGPAVFDLLLDRAVVVHAVPGPVWHLPRGIVLAAPSAASSPLVSSRAALELRATEGVASFSNPRLVVLKIGAKTKAQGHAACVAASSGAESCYAATPPSLAELRRFDAVMSAAGADRCWLSGRYSSTSSTLFFWSDPPRLDQQMPLQFESGDPNEGSAAGVTYNYNTGRVRDRDGTDLMDSACCYCFPKALPLAASDVRPPTAAIANWTVFADTCAPAGLLAGLATPPTVTPTLTVSRTRIRTRTVTDTRTPDRPLRTLTPRLTASRSLPTASTSSSYSPTGNASSASESLPPTRSKTPPSTRSRTHPPTPSLSSSTSQTRRLPVPDVALVANNPASAASLGSIAVDAPSGASTAASAVASVVSPSAATKPTAMQRMSSTVALCAEGTAYEDDGFPSVYNFIPWFAIGSRSANPNKESSAKVTALAAAAGAAAFTAGAMLVAAVAIVGVALGVRVDRHAADDAEGAAAAAAAADKRGGQSSAATLLPPGAGSQERNRDTRDARRAAIKADRRRRKRERAVQRGQIATLACSSLMAFCAAFFAPSVSEAAAFILAAPESDPEQLSAATATAVAAGIGLVPFVLSCVAAYTPPVATGLATPEALVRARQLSRPSVFNAVAAVGFAAVDGTRDPLRRVVRCVALFDVATAVCVAVLSGMIRGRGSALCGWAPVLMVVLTALYLLYLVGLRPFEDRFELVVMILLSTLQLAVSALIAAALLIDSSYANTATQFATVSELTSLAAPVALALWSLKDSSLCARCRDKDDDSHSAGSPHSAAENGAEVAGLADMLVLDPDTGSRVRLSTALELMLITATPAAAATSSSAAIVGGSQSRSASDFGDAASTDDGEPNRSAHFRRRNPLLLPGARPSRHHHALEPPKSATNEHHLL